MYTLDSYPYRGDLTIPVQCATDHDVTTFRLKGVSLEPNYELTAGLSSDHPYFGNLTVPVVPAGNVHASETSPFPGPAIHDVIHPAGPIGHPASSPPLCSALPTRSRQGKSEARMFLSRPLPQACTAASLPLPEPLAGADVPGRRRACQCPPSMARLRGRPPQLPLNYIKMRPQVEIPLPTRPSDARRRESRRGVSQAHGRGGADTGRPFLAPKRD